MEALQTVIQRLSVPSSNINVEIIQEVLIATKKASIQNEEYEEFNIILEMLWDHLKTGLEEFDDQLLCSTCFYNVLNKSTKQEFYLNQILIIINDELEINEKNHDNISLATTLCYGLFQSSYLANDLKNTAVLENTMKSIFKLLVRMSYEYTQYTFIAFKTMSSFKKVIGTSLEMTIFSNENKIKMLHVINNNWENPITGIRNLNRILFQTLLQVINDDVLTQIIREINKFYWNKAKYLMLTEVILKYSGNIVDYVLKNMWLGGLLNSLYKPGLVSAGADMYYAILEKLNSENCWTTLFLEPVIELLTGASFQAIENFKNYWCLNTFKKFPTLAKDLVQHLKLASYSELKLYSILCVLKQANKLALIERKWTTASHNSNEQLVLTSIDHCNAFIRMTAFEITCVSHQKCLPTQIEYEQILNYLRDNINSDCTVLRLCMINSLDSFLTQLHTNFMNIVNDEGLSPLKCFFKSLQSFIIESLSLYGNYQRKITTIKVLYTIFNSLSGKSKKKNKKQNCSSKPTLLTFLKENNCWEFDNADFILKLMSLLKDPANDVHENVLQLLCNYYLNDFNNSNLFICLVEEGLTCVKSKFFYEICSGHNIFKLIVNVLIETNKFINKEVNFKTIIDVFQFAYKEIDCGSYSKENIVKSIIEGRQLHAYLGILFVIFDASLKTGFKIPIDYEGIIKLVDVLEIISNQFAWEEDTLTSSDFSKMSDMVQTLINNSEYAEENNQDQTKISGFHQIVLNCLWLNVKAACDLASLLILYCKEYVEVCEKCLHIIMHVLETSRHKGAIEAAGAALGQGINYLTSTKLSPEVSQLPFILLKKKLNELLYETAKMSSVTRRGAGLSIMVHRIVSNDRKKGKPLFHYFMVELLTTCKSLDKNCEVEKSDKDLPKAIYIHFLTRIVTDSSLASDIMYYSADLAELAFDNLTNSNWQIRYIGISSNLSNL
ncbi:uncharacterized protein LOC116770886 [Danaus plexippus]|uniref:uncharacterized protein LOC116770886 n=1 Tax=Danaus plexippus TaxID=13037 RepID=UPI002AAFA22F|nr:uncharacterized protein LOC116770886 [Danaus plexippus]